MEELTEKQSREWDEGKKVRDKFQCDLTVDHTELGYLNNASNEPTFGVFWHDIVAGAPSDDK